MSFIRRVRLSLVLLCFAFTGTRALAAPTQTKARLGVPFQISWKKSTVIAPEKLSVTFTRVVEDSRCPSSVECVWEGQVIVLLTLQRAGRSLGSCTLTVRGHNRSGVKSIQKVGPYWIELQRVEPYPAKPGDKKDPESVTVLVQKKPIPTPTP